MMRVITIILLFIGMGSIANGQQSQMYTQFMYTKLALNPAYAGNDPYTNLSLLYRDQWAGFPGAPKAVALTVNFGRISNKIGLGAHLERQTLGITEKITYSLAYAYKFLLGEGVLSMGIDASGREYSQNYTDGRLFAIHGLNADPSIPADIIKKRLFNAGFGMYYNTRKFYVGFAIPRMIKADIDFDKNNFFSTEVRHVFVMTGGTFVINKNLRWTPQLLFKIAENSPFSLDLNASATYQDKYSIGLTYRSGGGAGDLGESLDFITGVQLSDQLMVGFAYDVGLSKLRKIENGSLEALVSYNFIARKLKTVIVNPRYF